MSKKTLILISSVIGVIVLCFLAWYFLLASEESRDTVREYVPFGEAPSSEDGDITDNQEAEQNTDDRVQLDSEGNIILPQLRQLSQEAVSGFTVLTETDGTTTTPFVRYNERATGHMYDTTLVSVSQTQITNKTIPEVYHSYWDSRGKTAILRRVRDESELIETISAHIIEKDPQSASSSTTTEDIRENNSLKELEELYLLPGIKNITVSPESNEVFYLSELPDRIEGSTATLKGNTVEKVFSSPLKDWQAQWVTKDTISLTTKPSAGSQGFLYFLNPQTQSFIKIIDGQGLTTLVHPDGSMVLYSESGRSGFSLQVFDRETMNSEELSPVTLPEKCAWKRHEPVVYCGIPQQRLDGAEPESWYKGLTSFTDTIWKINTETGSAEIVFEPSKEGVSVDVIKPQLSENEEYLVFVNKKDYTLWSVRLQR